MAILYRQTPVDQGHVPENSWKTKIWGPFIWGIV